MKNFRKYFIVCFVGVMVLLLTACSSKTAAATTQETYTDPFAYCKAVGQIDTPDARYTGPKMSDSLFADYVKAAGLDSTTDFPDSFKQATIWRCMNSEVYACNYGANIPCDSKANTDKTATQAMTDYCKQNPGSDTIPMSVTGHDVINNWKCNNDTPEIGDAFDKVDAAGYASSYWTLVTAIP
jgi:hypothetical protein